MFAALAVASFLLAEGSGEVLEGNPLRPTARGGRRAGWRRVHHHTSDRACTGWGVWSVTRTS